MNEDLIAVLQALYTVEGERLSNSDFNGWVTPEAIAANLAETGYSNSEVSWVRARLNQLWVARKILLISVEPAEPDQFVDVELIGLDRHDDSGKLRLEANDVRGVDASQYQQVALYGEETPVKVRSRVAEIGRQLSLNYLRFGMAPATGVIRYERRPQQRPRRNLLISEVMAQWRAQLEAGEISVETPEQTRSYRLRSGAPLTDLVRAMEAVMQALSERLGPSRDRLAGFQVSSVAATLAGIYSSEYRASNDAHVITAGVGSGKSFAFQIGALIHAATVALTGQTGLRVLLLYPRVVLAANQFQELRELVVRTAELLEINIPEPLLDAGGLLAQQLGIGEQEGASLFRAVQRAYGSGDYPIIISNLDTLANRLTHPEAARGLVENLDLIVCDELHLLAGLYGSHARMLLKRIALLRAMWKLRAQQANQPLASLLSQRSSIARAYYVGASATIAAPKQHAGRLFEMDLNRVLSVDANDMEDTGWVHHFFIRQRPEVSTMSSLVNATAALIHNRRDSLFREYYQESDDGELTQPIGLDQLGNPIQGGGAVVSLQATELIHKTIGFCDSLDGVGRWADLVADNEGTKMNGTVRPNPGTYPYFTRFQEPLWRQVHQRSFAANPPNWIRTLRTHYGNLCRLCKKGQCSSVPRVPAGLSAAGQNEFNELWNFIPSNPNSYLSRLGVSDQLLGAEWFAPVREAAQQDSISNLDRCPFFQTGLCWWWSMDHAGSNAPAPASAQAPLNGVRMAGPRADGQHHFVNGIRLSRFTSETKNDVMGLSSINDIFRGPARLVLRDMSYNQGQSENSVFVIGSPRLEVGVDLSRVRDGITYRAMRDPASLQQKVGRVGREPGSDSVLVHLVTQNTRDQYYFRNPQIALDPQYLQALPLHEDNRIVARHHLFMAIVDFISIQAVGPTGETILDQGERIALVNDHAQIPAFGSWDRKVRAVFEFLFGQHSSAAQNLENLKNYLRSLGASEADLTQPQAAALLTPSDAPMSQPIGAIDLFKHEFGPNFFLTDLPGPGAAPVTLAWAITSPGPMPLQIIPQNLPRHREFLRQMDAALAQGGGRPVQYRSYMRDLLGLPLFRRGLPSAGLPGNHPFVWTPNFFQAVGVETVRVVDMSGAQPYERGYESVSLALSLLAPGTVTYRYSSTPFKVPVGGHHAIAQPSALGPLLQRVMLKTDTADYFEAAESCPDIEGIDLPPDFVGFGPVKIYTPKQLALIRSESEPRALPRGLGEGLLVDGDSRPVPVGAQFAASIQLPQPPRSYALRWYRLATSSGRIAIESRFQRLLREYSTNPPAFPWPPVFSMFSAMDFDPQLEITDYVWGLDRQFTSRRIDAARLVYWRQDENNTPVPMSLGHRYVAPGLIFTVDLSPESEMNIFLTELLEQSQSVVFQTLLPQVLQRFIAEHGRVAAGGWFASPRPSVFAIRNLSTIMLFHLLDRWHQPGAETSPQPPIFSIEQLAGCFNQGHANWISPQRFNDLCTTIAPIHEPPSVTDHRQTLMDTRASFDAAAVHHAEFNENYFRRVARDLLLNSLGLSLHEAALRLSGAERENLGYFYRERGAAAEIFIFDKDAFGNGTAELVRDHIFVPNAQRALATRLRMLGQQPDPLPTKDFARCFEEELHECGSSQAAHLAFHNLSPQSPCWDNLISEFHGERTRAGALYDFLRNEFGMDSFDSLSFFQACPEYVAAVSSAVEQPLVGSPQFPAFQALESAFGFCLSGCVGCLVSPETNQHGSLEARDSVNKVLLDAFYRRSICESNAVAASACYPASGPSRTCPCAQATLVQTAALGQNATSLSIELMLPAGSAGEEVVSIVSPLINRGASPPVFRTSWLPLEIPQALVRVRMDF